MPNSLGAGGIGSPPPKLSNGRRRVLARRSLAVIQQEIDRAKQLVLPIVSKQTIPKMYVLMDGVHIPVVAAETEGRTGYTPNFRFPILQPNCVFEKSD